MNEMGFGRDKRKHEGKRSQIAASNSVNFITVSLKRREKKTRTKSIIQ